MTRVIVIAQARMGSSRLPGKVLRRAGELSLLEHLARRLARAVTPSDRVIATTTDPSDDELAEAARALGFVVFRGPVDDVLARYVGALAALAAAPDDLVVRVTADCPLLDPAELDRCVREFGQGGLDYLTNQGGERRRIPRGLDVEVFSVAAITRAHQHAREAGEREHVTPYLYREPGRFRVRVSDPPGDDLGHLRLTVDTPEDLALVDAIVRALGPEAETAAIARWLAEHPEVARLNAGVQQKSIADERTLRASRIAGRLLLARADASPSVGFGHVTRVGALLDAWTEAGGRACLVGHGVSGANRERLEAAGVELVAGGNPEFETRFADAAALVVDGYAFGEAEQRRWAASNTLLAIDDLAAHPQHADLVVNQILEFPPERYVAEPHTRVLVGHPYVLLRREFRGATPRPPEPRVVLTFGGSDPAKLSARLAAALLERCTETIQVVAGSGIDPSLRAELEGLAAADARLELHVDVRDMAALLAGAALVVSAAGTTVWEAMALGVPVVTVAVADNQRPVLVGIEQRGAGLSLGWHAQLDPHAAAARIAELLAAPERRAELARRGRALVDGRGVYRVLDALLDRLR
jgi:spore coat polysaccharide biosynthesis protein SpsF